MPKRLYRSKANRVIGGVCGGLGEYFGIDPIIFRVLFLFLSPLFWIYFILWIFVTKNPNQIAATKGTAFWKILLIILFFFLPIIFTVVFFAGSIKILDSTNTEAPFSRFKNKYITSATDLVKDAHSKMEEVIKIQNNPNATDVERAKALSLIVSALSEYKQATEKDPTYIDAWSSLAVINQKLGDAIIGHQSSADIQDQTTLYNESARAYNHLGILYLQKGQKDKAIESFQQALKIVPSNNGTLKNNIQQALKAI